MKASKVLTYFSASFFIVLSISCANEISFDGEFLPDNVTLEVKQQGYIFSKQNNSWK